MVGRRPGPDALLRAVETGRRGGLRAGGKVTVNNYSIPVRQFSRLPSGRHGDGSVKSGGRRIRSAPPSFLAHA